jgi:hypothetical protein
MRVNVRHLHFLTLEHNVNFIFSSLIFGQLEIWFQEDEAPRISRQSVYKGGKVLSPKDQQHLLRRRYSWYSFLLDAESTPGP